MKAERNKHSTALKLLVTALSEKLSPNEWRKVALILVDAMKEIKDLEAEVEALREKVAFLVEDRDYWQHKWGNGSA